MTEPLIELEGVDKTYRFFRLSNVGLRLEAGQILGFVGPNGAGKTTTIRIAMGMIRPERGSVRVLGHSMARDQALAKRDIGYVSEDMQLHGSATLEWHLRFVASIYPGWDAKYADLLLRRFNLHREQAVKALSHGERVKATLLLALARRPRLLLLDEPTTGLDPVARHEILAELMDVVRDERRAILFSSHNTQDVEQISDQITFIDRGRIIDTSDKEAFLERWRRLHLDVPTGRAVPELPGTVTTTGSGHIAVVTTNAYTPGIEAVYVDAGLTIRDVQRMTLEEIFVTTVMSNRRESDQ
jgi:ABC-2 type transport system ATP-binding protein